MPKPENVIGKGFEKHPERINRKGRPPVLPELKEVIAKIMNEEQKGMSGLEAVLRSLLVRAVKGDTRAASELLDRYYGKAQQNVNIAQERPIIKIYQDWKDNDAPNDSIQENKQPDQEN